MYHEIYGNKLLPRGIMTGCEKILQISHATTRCQILDCVQEAQERAASGRGMNAYSIYVKLDG